MYQMEHICDKKFAFKTKSLQYKLLLNQGNNIMSSLAQEQTTKRNYSRITLKQKNTLVRLVLRKAVSIDEAIKVLSLKKTTAINIINLYKKTGYVPARKYKKGNKTTKGKHGAKKNLLKQEEQGSQHSASEPNIQVISYEPQSFINLPYIAWMCYPMFCYEAY